MNLTEWHTTEIRLATDPGYGIQQSRLWIGANLGHEYNTKVRVVGPRSEVVKDIQYTAIG